MNARQNAVAQALVRAEEFVTSHQADFTHTPPTKVDQKYASTHTRLKQAITALGGKAAIQASGGYGASTEEQRSARQKLEDALSEVNDAADAIADETDNEALMDRFRMPDGRGDEELKGRARGMAAAIRELSLNDEFEAHGFSADTAAALEALAAALTSTEGEQGKALGEQAGATAAIPGHLQMGKSALKTLSVIFRRVYAGQTDLLTAWKTASHIERPERRKKKDSPPPAT
jgi:hypothetical protein